MAADYTRIHRLLKVLLLVQGRGGLTPRGLAQECGTSERTIYRDVRTLESAGVPVSFDRESGGYRVRGDFFLPPVQLTLDETLALAALGEHVAGKEQVPFLKPAERAITKLRTMLPASLRDELAALERHVKIRLASSSPPEAGADVYERLRRALAKRSTLRCTYESVSKSGKSSKPFVFRAYALMFNQRAWYVIGHHGGHDEVRTLRLTRFTALESTGETYVIPKNFSLDGHLGNAWRMIRGKGSFDVELKFDAEFADTISDTLWHRTQQVTWNGDESITFRCKVDGLDEIVWWIMSMGPHCTVINPRQLRARVAELATQTAQLYGKEK